MYFLALIILSFTYSVEGSQVLLTSSPSEVQHGLTSSVSVRCAVQDTAASASVVGRRDVARTEANVAEVSSIIIMLNGKDIASVSHANSARIMDGSTNTQTAGSVAKSASESGFLQVTITDPTQAQTGELQCEVSAVKDNSHGVTLTHTINLTYSEPTIVDLVQHVRQLETAVADGQKERDALKKEVAEGKSERNSLKTQVTELQHTETGVVRCGSDSGFSGRTYFQGEHTRSKDVYHSFQHAYASTPTVHIGMVELDAGDDGSRYFAELRSVSRTGFYVRCHVWNTSRIYKMSVSFVSVAKH